MAKRLELTPIRGAIRASVSTSTEDVVAGKQFSIFVKVQNPFDLPMTIFSISTHLPVELVDMSQQLLAGQRRELEQQIVEINQAGALVGLKPDESYVVQARRSLLSRFLSDITLKVSGIEIGFGTNSLQPAIARDITQKSQTVSMDLELPIIGNLQRTIKSEVKSNQKTSRKKRSWKDALSKKRDSIIEALNHGSRTEIISTKLQPGNSMTRVFAVRSRQRLFLKPSAYKLQIRIEYGIDSIRNIDTFEHALSIKSSLASMIIGSVIGGGVGWFVSRKEINSFDFKVAINLAISLCLSIIAVVLFARKKDVQTILAIEDFWGRANNWLP